MLGANYKALGCKFAYMCSCHLLHSKNNVPKFFFLLQDIYLTDVFTLSNSFLKATLERVTLARFST